MNAAEMEDGFPTWIPAVLVGLMMFGGYAYFFARGGAKGQYQRMFGMPPGESVAHLWFGGWHVNVSAGAHVAAAMVGMTVGGKQIIVGLSDQGRLYIKNHEMGGDVYIFGPTPRPMVEDIGDAGTTFSGERGMEPGRLVRITDPQRGVVEIATTLSAAQTLAAWSRGL
ncbi:MAG: hypothetical protein JNK05_39850 [Myxococcales bacterium]|nr:hypothetical protein [Myxococcales bacterium]